ncbi:hypothetical protein JYU34_005194 [Plutella xylostella]|uniref:Uncharacterized protein n=1 Tax=Plutella xylostella TaxID=51655 RepID=A0ABQ7QW25_PLUXY|nr:hypothetical protein JYU34_005194 [Plutella xylostella]
METSNRSKTRRREILSCRFLRENKTSFKSFPSPARGAAGRRTIDEHECRRETRMLRCKSRATIGQPRFSRRHCRDRNLLIAPSLHASLLRTMRRADVSRAAAAFSPNFEILLRNNVKFSNNYSRRKAVSNLVYSV